MKLRVALALCALATPLHAQSLPTPNLGTGTKLNGTNLQNAATKTTGTSVADPGIGALEVLLPVQTFTGASHAFVAADLYKETRRSNSGSAMTDTFPGASTAGLANGTSIQFNNADASASVTISAGSGTTVNGTSTVVVGPLRSTKWVYDFTAANWRPTMNSLTAVLGPASAASGNIATFNGTSGVVIQDSGKAPPAGAIVGTSDVQTLTNKTIDTAGLNTIKFAGVDVTTAFASSTSTITSCSGSLGAGATGTMHSKIIGKIVLFTISISIPNGGTGTGCVNATLPSTAAFGYIAHGNSNAGRMLQGIMSASSNIISIYNYDATYPAAGVLTVTGFYESI